MRFLLVPFGSAGDFYPYVWMGKVLLEAGHDAAVIGSSFFQEEMKLAGVPLIPLEAEADFVNVAQDRRLFDVKESPELIMTKMGENTRAIYRAIRDQKADRDTVLIAPSFVFAARVARERLGARLISVHLQPSALISMYDTPVLSEDKEWLTRLPVWLKSFCFRVFPNPIDRFPAPAVYQVCREEGIQPPRSLHREWWNSPDGSIGLFADFFGAPQPDWPARMHQVGFPLYDVAENQPLSPELEEFLAAGEKPILFTPGSAMRDGEMFFAAALEAVNAIGRRAIFVTRFPERLPVDLPPSVLPVQFCSFARLAPRVAAMVHHGGIGTLAQALRAGAPQLIMPMAHDQPDNAARLRRLGVAETLYPPDFTDPNVAQKLRALLDSPQVQERCRHWQSVLAEANPATSLKVGLQRMLGPLNSPPAGAGSDEGIATDIGHDAPQGAKLRDPVWASPSDL